MNGKIVFLLGKKPSEDEEIAWRWLAETYPDSATRMGITAAADAWDTISAQDNLIWWHDSVFRPEEAAVLKPALKNHLDRGGRLLFTASAALYPHRLGLENRRPNHYRQSIWDAEIGEREIRGYMGYPDHPVFSSFHGGIYTWRPARDEAFDEIAFAGDCFPDSGEILAVERFYIGFDSRKRIAWQRLHLGGYYLVLAAHIKFAATDPYYAPHLMRLLQAAIQYLRLGRYQSVSRPIWVPHELGVSDHGDFGILAHPLPAPSFSTDIDLDVLETDAVPADGFWDLAGRQILIMGEGNDDIDEIWTYPFRAVRSLSWQPRGEFTKMIRATRILPARRERTYDCGKSVVREVIRYLPGDPAAFLTLELAAGEALVVEMSALIDLPMMWPFEPSSAGPLQVSAQACGVCVTSGLQHSVVLWSNRPLIHSSHRDVTGLEASAVGMRFDCQLTQGEPLFILIASHKDGPLSLSTSLSELAGALSEKIRTHKTKLVEGQRTGGEAITPDSSVNQALRWAKWQIMTFDIEVPELGRGLAAGFGLTGAGWLKSRPGYAWFFGRDAAWCALAILHLGRFGAVRACLELMAKYQEFTGKIYHELSTSGVVHYDAADSTPLFIFLVAEYLAHSGDSETVSELWPAVEKAFGYCLSTDRDGDGFIENTDSGHGWIEGGRLFGAHVTSYLAAVWIAAVNGYSDIAAHLNRDEIATEAAQLGRRLRIEFRKRFWVEVNQELAYGLDHQGQALRNLCIMPSVAILLDIPTRGQSSKTLAKIDTTRFSTDWGVRMISHDSPEYDPKGYHYGAVWPLYTGWIALADYMAGRSAQGFLHWQHQIPLFRHHAMGSVPEVLHGDIYSFAGVCQHQAWSEAMVILPFYRGLLGLRPTGDGDRLEMRPQIPFTWSRLELKRYRLGNTLVSFSYRLGNGEASYAWQLEQGDPVQILFRPEWGAGTVPSAWFEDENPVPSAKPGDAAGLKLTFELQTRKTIKIRFERILKLEAIAQAPEPGCESRGYMIVDESHSESVYRVRIHGLAGVPYSALLKVTGVSLGRIQGAVIGGKAQGCMRLDFEVGADRDGFHEIIVNYG